MVWILLTAWGLLLKEDGKCSVYFVLGPPLMTKQLAVANSANQKLSHKQGTQKLCSRTVPRFYFEE